MKQFFFLKQQILFKNQFPAQDEQRPVIQRIQTKGTVYNNITFFNLVTVILFLLL